MDGRTREQIWKQLEKGGRIPDLDVPRIDGRVDLRSLDVPARTPFTTISNAVWKDLDFSKARLESLRFIDCTMENCVFAGAKCHDWRMWGTSISRSNFVKCDLRNSALGGLAGTKRNRFLDLDFTGADLRESAHGSADFVNCLFSQCKLKGVDFQGDVFSGCRFEGSLRDVLFYRHMFRGEHLAPNEMKDVDFSKASLLYVQFRNLDMESVRWPESESHYVIENFRPRLARWLEILRSRNSEELRGLVALLESDLKWAGPNQKRGVISREEVFEWGGEAALASFLTLLREA